MENVEYRIEYRFPDESTFKVAETFEYKSDAKHAYLEHINTYKHCICRLTRVALVEKVECLAEYSLSEDF